MDEYEQKAIDFLALTNTKLLLEKIDVVDHFPFDSEDEYPHDHYKVWLQRGKNEYTYDYYGSYFDYTKKRFPTTYDLLACLEKDDVGSMADFVEEFGYVIKDRKSFLRVERIWHACKKQYKELTKMFNEEEMDMLREIC